MRDGWVQCVATCDKALIEGVMFVNCMLCLCLYPALCSWRLLKNAYSNGYWKERAALEKKGVPPEEAKDKAKIAGKKAQEMLA